MPNAHSLAVDLGGTHMRVAVVDERGTIVDRDESPTPHDADTIDAFLDLVVAMRARHEVDHAVVGVPGRVDHLAGTLLHAPNLPPKWFSLVTRDTLQDAVGVPTTLVNDADAAVVGEAHFGAGRGHRDVTYVTISTGIGAGIVVDGRVMLPRYSGGEIGHTHIEGGEVEHLGSGTALARLARERGLDVDGPGVVALVRNGDATAVRCGTKRCTRPASGSPTSSTCSRPTILVVGGGVGSNSDLVLPPIRDALERYGPVGPPPDIVPAELGDDPGLVGAAAWKTATGQ